MKLIEGAPTLAAIGEGWVDSGRTFDVRSPFSGKVLASVVDCGEKEARLAADAAVASFGEWKRTTAYERSAVLRKWFELIMARQDQLARLMALEMGKPVAEGRGEVRYAAAFVELYAEEAKRVSGETFPSQFAHKRLFAIKQPVGPVYAVTPWNFPAAMVTRKAAPALAAGCTMIVKPAEQSPLTAIALAALWREAGGPPAALQVLPCADPVPVSRILIDDDRIRKVTFTGSTEVGIKLYGQVSHTVKRLSLELGGHAPFLVFEDANVDLAVREVVAAKYRNAGQTCVCANRIYVHQRIADQFVERLGLAAAALVVGDPLDEQVQVGPLVDRDVFGKVEAHVADAVAKGAQLVTGGKALGGTLYAPTVLAGVGSGMRLMNEETFGPVAPVRAFRDEAEAIGEANATKFGLAAYLWTNDLSRAVRVSESLEYGIIGINDGVPSAPQAPFGGVKHSGLGREGGHWGIDEYLDVKYLSVRIQPS